MSETKVCSHCKIEKSFLEFTICKRGERRYLKSTCKKCEAKRVNVYRIKNLDLVKLRKKKYWEENKGRLLESHNEKSRIYNKLNPEKRKESANKWARKNRRRIIDYTRNRYHTDAEFNIGLKHRRRIVMALKRIGAGRRDRMIDLLGCTYTIFKDYIEAKFTEGMNWELVLNGQIHLDHIRPCSKFNLLYFEEQKVCFHFSNYQPLWAVDNMVKHNKYSLNA